MEKKIKGGEIFCIPLFMEKVKSGKLKKGDEIKQFVFGRAIEEEAGKILIEVFKKTGDLSTEINTILSSGLLMKPLYTIWDGVKKNRWKIIYQTENYDKEKDSNYNDIQLVLGGIDDLRVWHAKDSSETPISREELIKGNYQLMSIYPPIQIEMKVIKALDL